VKHKHSELELASGLVSRGVGNAVIERGEQALAATTVPYAMVSLSGIALLARKSCLHRRDASNSLTIDGRPSMRSRAVLRQAETWPAANDRQEYARSVQLPIVTSRATVVRAAVGRKGLFASFDNGVPTPTPTPTPTANSTPNALCFTAFGTISCRTLISLTAVVLSAPPNPSSPAAILRRRVPRNLRSICADRFAAAG